MDGEAASGGLHREKLGSWTQIGEAGGWIPGLSQKVRRVCRTSRISPSWFIWLSVWTASVPSKCLDDSTLHQKQQGSISRWFACRQIFRGSWWGILFSTFYIEALNLRLFWWLREWQRVCSFLAQSIYAISCCIRSYNNPRRLWDPEVSTPCQWSGCNRQMRQSILISHGTFRRNDDVYCRR